MTDLAPCPWTSKSNHKHTVEMDSSVLTGTTEELWSYWVECSCGASSPTFDAEDDAVAAWDAMWDEHEAILADRARLDWMDENLSRAENSERYLTRRVYWGGGSKHDIRSAIDRARGEGAVPHVEAEHA